MRTLKSLAGPITLAAAAFAAPTFALELPKPEDPAAQELIARTGMDVPKLEAGWQYARPAPQQWPCEIPVADIYTAAGLYEALTPEQLPPEQKAAMEQAMKEVRRKARQAGTDIEVPKANFSNIVLIPIKATCAKGKLDGETEFYVSYESSRKGKTQMFSQTTKKMEEVRTNHRDAGEKMVKAVFVAGKMGPDHNSFSRSTAVIDAEFDDPVIQKYAKPAEPVSMRSASFAGKGTSVSFMEMPSAEFSSGFLGPNVKQVKKLQTTIMVRSEKTMRMYSFMDADLSTKSHTNNETKTTATVMYVDNFYKKMGIKKTESAGTENQKEVVVNGKDMLESRMCIMNGGVVKIDPCPVE